MNRIEMTIAAVCAAWLFAAGAAYGVDERNLTNGITAEGAPLAVRGYDLVAYFEDGVATQGSATHAATHGGATYYFTSQENLQRFEDAPQRFLPAYGGFCAYGVSVGKKFDADPRYWRIEGGRLYLNLNGEIAEAFAKDVPGALAKAERSWKKIEHEAIGDL